jgi:hypothetical protein
MNLLDLIIKVLSAHNLVLFEINFHHLTWSHLHKPLKIHL